MIHVYFGNGKGKTTAAVGLATRCAGHGKHVIFAQFLKSRDTGEIVSLIKLGIHVIRSEKTDCFSWEMNKEQKEECKKVQAGLFDIIVSDVQNKNLIDMLVLDEALNALSEGFLDEKELKDFIISKSEDMEIVLTGRVLPDWLKEMADYCTEMKKHKHPYDKGTQAREAVEY